MFAAVTVATLSVGEVTIGIPANFLAANAHPMVQVGGLDELSSLLSRFSQMPSPTVQRAPTPTNPCYEDMKKLRCTDASCLRRNAELLSPTCAAFLLDQQGYPEPSPSPAPYFSVSRVVPVLARRPAPRPSSSGYFSMYSNINGKVQHMEGPVGGQVLQPMAGLTSLLPFSEMMLPVFESGLSQMSREMDRVFDELEAEAEADVPQHPCWREVPACIDETGSEERDAIYGCLLRHRSQLSHECGCFVDHTVRPAAAAPAPAKAIAAVPVRAAPGAVVIEDVYDVEEVQPMHPLHRLSCLFIFTAFVLLTVMVLRACLSACFAPRKVPREVVMTPPRRAKIVAVMRPMRSADVQVAEPLPSKA